MTSHKIDLTCRRASANPRLLALLPPQTREFADRCAPVSSPVLLSGETGSGKTHLARLIHQLGPRASEPYITHNCSRGEALFESEMFGHVKGAFTGATQDRRGIFETATGGTLLLDEVGELPVNMQPKLLQVLDDQTVRRVGSTRDLPVSIRIITATNRDLRQLVETKEFREDLFYRISYLKHRVPSLRERKEQLPEIARYFLEKLGGAYPPPRSMHKRSSSCRTTTGQATSGS